MAVTDTVAQAAHVPGRLTLVVEGEAKDTTRQGVGAPVDAAIGPPARPRRAKVPVAVPVTRRTATVETQGARGAAGGATPVIPRAMRPIWPLEEGATRRRLRRAARET